MHSVENGKRHGQVDHNYPGFKAKDNFLQSVVVLRAAAEGRRDPKLQEKGDRPCCCLRGPTLSHSWDCDKQCLYRVSHPHGVYQSHQPTWSFPVPQRPLLKEGFSNPSDSLQPWSPHLGQVLTFPLMNCCKLPEDHPTPVGPSSPHTHVCGSDLEKAHIWPCHPADCHSPVAPVTFQIPSVIGHPSMSPCSLSHPLFQPPPAVHSPQMCLSLSSLQGFAPATSSIRDSLCSLW